MCFTENKDFVYCLKKAISGNDYCINKIIEEYKDLIKKYSKINGSVDDDCVSHITITIIKAIKKFKNL